MFRIKVMVAVAAASLAAAPAHAGPFSDDLGRCLVANSSDADRVGLVQWMFASLSAHPDVAPLANISAERRTQLDRQTGTLFQRLVTVACRKQAVATMKYEGSAGLQGSFQVLG